MANADENQLVVVREALSHTEMRIANLNSVASGAESRSLHFATLTTAFGTILAINAKNLPGPFFAYLTALLFLLLSCLAVSLTLPRRFHVAGHFWEDWKGHVVEGDQLVDVLISQAEENDDRIRFNDLELNRSARKFTFCFICLIVIVSFLVGSQLGAFLALG